MGMIYFVFLKTARAMALMRQQLIHQCCKFCQ